MNVNVNIYRKSDANDDDSDDDTDPIQVEKCWDSGFEGLDLFKMNDDWYLNQVSEHAFRGYHP